MSRFIFSFFIVSLIFSCGKEIPFDNGAIPSSEIINCIIYNDSTTLQITKSLHSVDYDTILFGEHDGYFLEVDSTNILYFDFNRNNKLTIIKSFLDGSESIKLNRKKVNNIETLSEIKLPRKPAIELNDTFYTYDYRVDTKFLNIKLNLFDAAMEDNYYIIEVYSLHKILDSFVDSSNNITYHERIYYSPLTFYSSDNSVEIISNGGIEFKLNNSDFTLSDDMSYPQMMVLGDKNFNGLKKEIILRTNVYFGYAIEVRVSSINREIYQFIKSIAAYNSNNSLFNEPVSINSNIKNGLGYFGAKISNSFKIQIR